MQFSGILFSLKLTQNRIYTAPAAQRSIYLGISPNQSIFIHQEMGSAAVIHILRWMKMTELLGAKRTFKPSRCIRASFYIPENTLNFLTTRGFRMKISMKLVYQYMAIFFNFSSTSSHLHPLQVENCGSNSRLVVDEDDYGKVRLERVKMSSKDANKPYVEEW